MKNNTTKDYRDYLVSDSWKLLRQEVFKRDGYKCTKCNSPKNLVAHHLHYINLFNEHINELETLCNKCHKIEHRRLNSIKRNRLHNRKVLNEGDPCRHCNTPTIEVEVKILNQENKRNWTHYLFCMNCLTKYFCHKYKIGESQDIPEKQTTQRKVRNQYCPTCSKLLRRLVYMDEKNNAKKVINLFCNQCDKFVEESDAITSKLAKKRFKKRTLSRRCPDCDENMFKMRIRSKDGVATVSWFCKKCKHKIIVDKF